MINISILIPIHNRLPITKKGLKYLKNALEYYYKLSTNKIVYEIIVIDDGSNDGSTEWISSKYPGIHIIKGDGSLWWSGAINLGSNYAIAKLKSDYLLLWNDDIIPDAIYFVNLEKLLKRVNLKKTIVGSRIMKDITSSHIWSLGGIFNRFSGKLLMKNNSIGHSDFIECDWLPGMGTLIPTEIILENKRYWDNKNFPQYFGDSDFVLWYKRHGVKIVTYVDLVIYNDPQTTRITKKENKSDIYHDLTDINSFYNVKQNIKFYTRHGILPFVFYGIITKYSFYFLGYLKMMIYKLTYVYKKKFM